MSKKVIVWAIPALFAVALLRSLFAAQPEPIQVAQAPSLFDEPAEVGRETYESPRREGEPDPDDYQPRSRLVRSMYDVLDGIQDGSVEGQGIDDDQRRFVRRELMLADEELAESGGENLKRIILRANNPRSTFSVGKPSAPQPLRREQIEELHRLRTPVVPADAAPSAVNPTPAVPPTAPPVNDPFN